MYLRNLIDRYFPEQERANALCIAAAEWPVEIGGSPSLMPPRDILVRDEGMLDCGQGLKPAKAYGPFALLDVCWDPALNPDSLFSSAQWASILDPNVNVWAASVVWSHGGWRSWTTCAACGACEVTGGPIPYPRGPVQVRQPLQSSAGPILVGVAGVGLVALVIADTR